MTNNGIPNIMINLITTLTSTSFLKNIFLGVFGFHTFLVIEQSADGGIYEAVVNNIPVQVLTVLGILAGIIWVARRADDAWTNHKLNVTKAKIQQEKAEQEEIETDKRKQELDEK